MTDATQTPASTTPEPGVGPLTHAVEFSRGMLAKALPGTLQYDGQDRVTLTSADGNLVMDKSVMELGKVKRAEYGLYFHPDGKLVFVAFGNAKAYGAASLASNISTPALAGASVYQHAQNKASGIEAWVTMLTERGVLKANFGPASRQTYVAAAAIAAVVIVVGGAIAYFAG